MWLKAAEGDRGAWGGGMDEGVLYTEYAAQPSLQPTMHMSCDLPPDHLRRKWVIRSIMQFPETQSTELPVLFTETT